MSVESDLASLTFGESLKMFSGYQSFDTVQAWLWDQAIMFYEGVAVPEEQKHYVTAKQTIATWIPPQAAVVAIPAIVSQTNRLMNKGWNSCARTVNEISEENYLEYTVNEGTNGAFIGIGPRGYDSVSIATFNHGIVIDPTGITVFENGKIVYQLKNTQFGASVIRIFLQPENKIQYMVITGNEVNTYQSLTKAESTKLYGYAYLYAAGDTINSSAINSGFVQFGRA